MRVIVAAVMFWACGTVTPLQAAPEVENVITVVVSDGPFAGTYRAGNTACLPVKDRNTLGCG